MNYIVLDKYLYELQIYEELTIIDENFITWAKKFKEDKLKKIANKLQDAFDRRDTNKIKKIVSLIPKPSIENLEKMAKKASPNYKKVSREASKQIGVAFAGVPSVEERLLTFIVSIVNENSDDFIKSIASTIKKIKKIRKTPVVKKIAGSEATVGLVLIVGAAVIALGAIASFSLPALIIALLLGGIALAFVMEGVKH